MITVWGKIAGLALGVFGGPIGAAFGLFLGHLVDLVAAQYLVRRSLVRFTAGTRSRTPRWFSPTAALAALTVVFAADQHWRPTSDEMAEFSSTLATRSPARKWNRMWHWLAIGPVSADRYLSAAVLMEAAPAPECLAVRIMSLPTVEERAGLIETCLRTLDLRVAARALARLRNLAQLAGLPEDWIGETLQPKAGTVTDIDHDDREILGIGPDATLDDVRRAYRRLAAQFHPDTMSELSVEQREASSAAFVRIRTAYDRVVDRLDRTS